MDKDALARETVGVEDHGSWRDRIARNLSAAYGDGLLSEHTLSHRLDLLSASHVIEPAGLLGDLSVRAPSSRLSTTVAKVVDGVRQALWDPWHPELVPRTLLALDWASGHDQLLVGRHLTCDVVLSDLSVSRRHALLRFRDGRWVLQDLESTNGTHVNGERVGRCQLRPGDALEIGDVRLLVD